MAFISWIQVSSAISLWIASPVDAKMKLDTDTRLHLTSTQRWLWCIIYDTDLNKWKQLINEAWNDDTVEDDWIDFWITYTINQEQSTIDWNTSISLNNLPVENSEDVYLDWIHITDWDDYTIDWKDITFEDWCVIDWDTVLIKYLTING